MITTMRGDKQVEAMQYILSTVSLNAPEPYAAGRDITGTPDA